MDVVSLNVGGTVFTTGKSTLKAVPGTKLSRLSTSTSEFDGSDQCFYFDRNPKVFDGILDFYRTGELHFPKDICGGVVKRELEFWEIPLGSVSDCCYATICNYDAGKDGMAKLRAAFNSEEMEFSESELRTSQVNRIRNTIWRLMHSPKSSKLALIYSLFYPLWLITPIVTYVMATHEACRELFPFPDIEFEYNNMTLTFTLHEYVLHYTGNPKAALMFSTEPKPGLVLTERICLLLFCLETIFRLVSCPRLLKLFKCPLLYIDFAVIIASLIAFGIEVAKTVEDNFWLYLVCKCFLIIRLFRLMHLARHIGGLRVLLLTIRTSVKELFLLLLSFVSVAVFFAAVLYYAEFDRPDSFEHMPISIWWSVVTMTTVGYGDYTPSTTVGYIAATLCALMGVLIISVPIAVIAANFTDLFCLNKIREEKEALDRNQDNSIASPENGNKADNKANKIGCITVTKIFNVKTCEKQ